VVCPGITTSYAVTDTERIGFTPDGIAYEYISSGKTRWVLTYREIAESLGVDFSRAKSILITRDCVLKSGLWRFAVRFDGQAEDTAYSIDVDPATGDIEWVVSIEDMPGDGVFTLTFGSSRKS